MTVPSAGGPQEGNERDVPPCVRTVFARPRPPGLGVHSYVKGGPVSGLVRPDDYRTVQGLRVRINN
jgi:hypothetical protein